jgi:hypothetical protein
LFLGGGATDVSRSKSGEPHKSSVGGGTIDSNEAKDSNFARDRSHPNRAIFLQEENKSIRNSLPVDLPAKQQQAAPNILDNKNQYISTKKRQEIEEL